MSPSAQNAGGGRRVTRWTRELIIEKIREWNDRYGEPPCSADWNPSLARWRAQEWRAERYREGIWPSTNAAKRQFDGSFDAALLAAGLEPRRPGPRRRARRAGEQAGRARRARERTRLSVRDSRELTLERLEEVVADADARVRAAEDQAEAAANDAYEARRAARAAEA